MPGGDEHLVAQAVEAAELAAGEPVGPGVVAKGGVAEAALSMCVEGEERGRGATFCEAHVEAISRGVDGEAPVSEVSVEDAASVGHGKSGEADAVSRGGGSIAAAGSVGAVKLVAQGELETVRVEGHRAEELQKICKSGGQALLVDVVWAGGGVVRKIFMRRRPTVLPEPREARGGRGGKAWG